jgi:hypothetical protein
MFMAGDLNADKHDSCVQPGAARASAAATAA